MQYKTCKNGVLIATGDIPRQIPGVMLDRINKADPEHLAKHGIVIEEYTPPEPSPPTPEEVWTRLNAEVNSYLFQKYDSGTQLSFTALYARADTPQVAKAAIQAVWDWQETVLNYYYDKKDLILAGDISVEWDFSSFDGTDPNIHLGDLR